MKFSPILLWLATAACLPVLIPNADAGLININLTESTATGAGMDGNAILGGGTWNRIKWEDAGNNTPLNGSNGNALSGITAADAGAPSGAPQANGNAVQSQAWGTPVDLTVSGLIVNQVYKVAVYSDRVGTFGTDDDIFTVNLVNKPLPKPGPANTALPGIEDVDYALFVVNASGTGTINITAPWIAGIQIEGVLPGEDGPQADGRVSDRKSKAGKGDGIYARKPRKAQTLKQDTKGKRPRRFFTRVENDGEEVDVFSLLSRWQKRKARVKVIDLDGGGNVTAKAFAGTHTFQLCKDEVRKFKTIVRAKKKRPGRLKVRQTGSPSTGAANRRDMVVLLTVVPRD